MRGFFRFITWLIMAAIVAALAIFAVQNIGSVPVRFVSLSFAADLWWIAIGAAILGLILGFLLLAPGHIGARWRGRGLQRERARLEQQVAELRAERDQLGESHERLRAEHRSVVAERDRLRAQRAAAATATPATAPATATPATAAAQPTVTQRQPVPVAPAQQTVPAAETRPDSGYVTQPQPQTTNGATASTAPEEQPNLGERVRAVFRRPTPEQQVVEEEQNDQYPQGPTAPTA